MRRAQRYLVVACIREGYVSILARRMRRAQRGMSCGGRRDRSFQSSPDACAGRNSVLVTRPARSRSFNPRPTHAPGATANCFAPGFPLGRFNPRPTHAPGATTAERPARALPDVSILARRMRRAQHQPISSEDGRIAVSILARRMRRAQLPAPAISRRLRMVSILARRMRRAQRCVGT